MCNVYGTHTTVLFLMSVFFYPSNVLQMIYTVHTIDDDDDDDDMDVVHRLYVKKKNESSA